MEAKLKFEYIKCQKCDNSYPILYEEGVDIEEIKYICTSCKFLLRIKDEENLL